MKKRIVGMLTIVLVTAISGIGVKMSLGYNDFRFGLLLKNIEAYANDEIQSGDPCYNDTKYDKTMPKVVKCGTPCIWEHSSFNSSSTSNC